MNFVKVDGAGYFEIKNGYLNIVGTLASIPSIPLNWFQKGDDIDGEEAGDGSGWSVSLSSDGNTVAIGALFNDDNGDNSGHVRVYEFK